MADAANAWEQARQAARARFGNIERTPAIKAALDDVAPDKAFDKLIVNGDHRDVVALVNELGAKHPLLNEIRKQILEDISDKSVNQVGTFSPKAYATALNKYGDLKLQTLFPDSDVTKLKDIGQAAVAMISHPNRSFVNHSNTAANVKSFMMPLLGLGKLAPLGSIAVDAAKTVPNMIKVRASLKGRILTEPDANAAYLRWSGAQKDALKLYGKVTDKAGRIIQLSAAPLALESVQ